MTRRTQNACRACRQSKIKCSGDSPCRNCQRRVMKCVFEEENVRVMVSRSYLHSLQRQVRELKQRCDPENHLTGIPPTSIGPHNEVEDLPSAEEAQSYTSCMQLREMPYSVWTSPFDVPTSVMRKIGHDRFDWVWLAPSSIFSFYDRLGLLMTERLGLEPPSFREQTVYPLQWTVASPDTPPDIGELPSIDHALFLLNVVKFNFSQVYRLFEEEKFVAHIKEFYYGDALQMAMKNRLWFVQFLLILAFGRAFSDRSNKGTAIPGADLFCRAMSLMPELTSIWQGGVAAIEVLALAGLYLYCIDHCKSAHLYLGQAIRIALMEGLHTQLPEEQLGKRTVVQCRNLWWTLYIMDRRFSSQLGIPVIVQDSDITTLITPVHVASQEDATLCLQVKLWQLMSHILSTIYKTSEVQLRGFLEMTRSILQSLADNAQEIERTIELKFYSSVGKLPKGTRLVTLTYHQCVIFATRPLLLSLLKERLDNIGQSEEVWQHFLTFTTPLISTGIKSASSMLQILSCEEELLEIFFLNDVEFVYGASLFLTMATALFPKVAEVRCYKTEAHTILDDMIGKGSRVAGLRKKELLYLEHLFDRFTERMNHEGSKALTLHQPMDPETFTREEPEQSYVVTGATGVEGQMTPDGAEMQQQFLLGDDLSMNLDWLDTIGISSCDLYSMTYDIGNQDEIPFILE